MSHIRPVLLNGCVFDCGLSGAGHESCCSHLVLRMIENYTFSFRDKWSWNLVNNFFRTYPEKLTIITVRLFSKSRILSFIPVSYKENELSVIFLKPLGLDILEDES